MSADSKGPMVIDPSKPVRSNDLMEVLKENLDIVRLAYTGSTISHFASDSIEAKKDDAADTVLQLVILFQNIMTQRGVLPRDYLFSIVKEGPLLEIVLEDPNQNARCW